MKKYLIMQLMVLLLLLSACGSSEVNLKRLSSQDIIVAFGDSLTYGTGAPQGQGYPEELQKLIGRTVINAGLPGDETAGGLARINEILEKYHPALVIVCLGGNDNLRKRNPDTIKANLENIIRAIQIRGIQTVLIAEPMFNFGLIVPEYYQGIGDKFSIPVDTKILVSLLPQNALKSDYIHFNAAGYQAFANEVAQFLRKRGAI